MADIDGYLKDKAGTALGTSSNPLVVTFSATQPQTFFFSQPTVTEVETVYKEKIVEKPVIKFIEKVVDRIIEREKIVYKDKIIEKLVYKEWEVKSNSIFYRAWVRIGKYLGWV